MEAGVWRGIYTVVMLLLFSGIVIWAWSGRRKKDFDEAAQLPLEPDQPAPPEDAVATDVDGVRGVDTK